MGQKKEGKEENEVNKKRTGRGRKKRRELKKVEMKKRERGRK